MQSKSARNSQSDDDCSAFIFLAGGWEVALSVSVATSSTSDIVVLWSTNTASALSGTSTT